MHKQKRERSTNRDKSNDYVDNSKFLEALRERKAQVDALLGIDQDMPYDERKVLLKAHKAAGGTLPRISEYIGECFLKISERRSKDRRFYNSAFRDELIGYGIEDCIKAIDNFDTMRDNPFAYFSQCVYWAFCHKAEIENVESRGRTKLLEHTGHELDSYHVDEHDLGTHFFDETIQLD